MTLQVIMEVFEQQLKCPIQHSIKRVVKVYSAMCCYDYSEETRGFYG
jgi:hypothetical protein